MVFTTATPMVTWVSSENREKTHTYIHHLMTLLRAKTKAWRRERSSSVGRHRKLHHLRLATPFSRPTSPRRRSTVRCPHASPPEPSDPPPHPNLHAQCAAGVSGPSDSVGLSYAELSAGPSDLPPDCPPPCPLTD